MHSQAGKSGLKLQPFIIVLESTGQLGWFCPSGLCVVGLGSLTHESVVGPGLADLRELTHTPGSCQLSTRVTRVNGPHILC